MEILIVDDDRSITKILDRYLRSKGHTCSISNDGQKGMSMCLEKKFDAIILDMMMPSFSGLDFIDSLEEHGKLEAQKIVVLTALDNHYKSSNENLKNGIVASFQKPVDLPKLLTAIEA